MPSSQTDVDIANLALAHCNTQSIATFGDANERARMAKRWYNILRQELLQDCDWTFARKTVELSLIGQETGITDFPDWAAANSETEDENITADNAVFPWVYIYQYPPKVLYVHSVYNKHTPYPGELWSGYQGTQWRSWLEQQRAGWELLRSKSTNEYAIACNIQEAICKYTYDMSDTSQFSANFVVALSLKLAQRLVMPLTGDKELKKQIDADLEASMTKAFRMNLSENPEQGPTSSSYEDCRNEG